MVTQLPTKKKHKKHDGHRHHERCSPHHSDQSASHQPAATATEGQGDRGRPRTIEGDQKKQPEMATKMRLLSDRGVTEGRPRGDCGVTEGLPGNPSITEVTEVTEGQLTGDQG